jgi:hypothetical protein
MANRKEMWPCELVGVAFSSNQSRPLERDRVLEWEVRYSGEDENKEIEEDNEGESALI